MQDAVLKNGSPERRESGECSQWGSTTAGQTAPDMRRPGKEAWKLGRSPSGKKKLPLVPLVLALLSGTLFLLVLLGWDPLGVFPRGKVPEVTQKVARTLPVNPAEQFVYQQTAGASDSGSHGQASEAINTALSLPRTATDLYKGPKHIWTRQVVDQISLGRLYVAIARESTNFHLALEFSNQVKACQALLEEADRSRRPVKKWEAQAAVQEMSKLTWQARVLRYDPASVLMKLRSQMQSTEEKLQSYSVQSTFYGQLAAEAIPKSLHCLGMRLTSEWGARTDELQRALEEASHPERLEDNSLHHFCIFSDNVLAVSVVVRSTIEAAAEPARCVFHIVTDEMNFGAMRAWFALNPPGPAAVQVQNIASFAWLNADYSPVMRQLQDAATQSYYFQASLKESKNTIKFRNPKYLSMLNHIRFYIPEIYPRLEKIVFLDDDLVVQKDLGPLFEMDLGGNVIGAVETCLDSGFHRYHKYLNFSDPRLKDRFDPNACGWAFGMNVFDLKRWKEVDITKIYHYWQDQNKDRLLWKLGTLPPGLLTFYDKMQPLDRSWHVLGLGYDFNVDSKSIKNAAVLHYNGNMKPWLKLALERYKPIWTKHVDFSQPFIQECNVH